MLGGAQNYDSTMNLTDVLIYIYISLLRFFACANVDRKQ